MLVFKVFNMLFNMNTKVDDSDRLINVNVMVLFIQKNTPPLLNCINYSLVEVAQQWV